MDLGISMSNHTDGSLAIARRVSMKAQAEKSNLIISPLSLNVVVSLIAAGSSGQTLAQLLSFLKSRSIDHLNRLSSEIVFADGRQLLWRAQALDWKRSVDPGGPPGPYKPSYQQVVQKFYKADSYRTVLTFEPK